VLDETLGECLKEEGNYGNIHVHAGGVYPLVEIGLKGNKHTDVQSSALLYKYK